MAARTHHSTRLLKGPRIGAIRARPAIMNIPKRVGRTTVARRISRRRLSGRAGFGFGR